jgi:hypothetical protein
MIQIFYGLKRTTARLTGDHFSLPIAAQLSFSGIFRPCITKPMARLFLHINKLAMGCGDTVAVALEGR